jgi:hypothetical protein
MFKRSIILIPFLLILSSCGPIIGQMMKMSEGVKYFKVVAGDISILDRGKNVLVVGPFDKESGAYHIAQGADAAMFFNEITEAKYMDAELYIGRKYGDLSEMVSSLRSMEQATIMKELHLQAEPDLLMFGTIIERATIVAPARGIIMEVAYRLEFYDPASKASTVVEVKVKEHFKDCIKLIVSEIVRQTAAARAK